MSIALLLSGDTVTVTPFEGQGAYGASYGAPVDVECRVESVRKVVRDAQGNEVVSETTIFVLPMIDAARAVDVFAPESLVTHDGRTSSVIGAGSHRGQGSAVYVEVTTT